MRAIRIAKAIAAYVERELTAIERIKTGLTDMRAGRISSHDDVMQEARAIIEEARAR